MISLSELAVKIKGEKKVALFCHVRPDGDCIGSALALANAIKTLGIEAVVVCDDPIPPRFLFLEDAKNVVNNLNIKEYSALMAIDCADVSRLGSFTEEFLRHKNTYNIDHHISNNHYAKVNYVKDSASNSENILSLIETMGVEIDKSSANCLLMGMMTDTGNFRHKNVKAETLFSAGKMLTKGADINTIYFHMFSAQSKERVKLFAKTMSKIRYFHDGRLAIATVRKEDFDLTGARKDDTEGFIDFVMGIVGVEVGACVMETEKDKYKISLRSKQANVNAVALSFGGGGHLLASGCQINGDYEDVIDKLSFAVSRELID